MNLIMLSQFLLFSAISVLQPAAAASSGHCTASCGSSGGAPKLVPFPFGFSESCGIQLNCSGASGEILIADFPVRTITSDSLLVHVHAKCHRPIQSLRRLFSRNFAPTSRNAILLQNCSASSLSPCELPTTMLKNHFGMHDCDFQKSTSRSNISCYSEKKDGGFMDFQSLEQTGCESIYSSIFVESFNDSAVSMEVQMVRLEWWLEGDCNCASNAVCSKIVTPVNRNHGFRCRCGKGFEGDGYSAGKGCRKISSTCKPSKYLSGHCRGPPRVGILLAGIAIGTTLLITAGLIWCFLCRKQSFKVKTSTKQFISEATGGNYSIPVYAYKEIERATNSFAEQQRLGTGAYGTVYLGKISNNASVAVKRIKHRDTDNIEQVLNEIKLLSSVSHPNLVRLLGCSIEKDEQILVYEFMPNGTLSQHLQREQGCGLLWSVRLSIATETAQAIAYLHSADPPIYHRDIKSNNILLDYEFKSKVADFGLSRLGKPENSHISTAPQGTPGYLDPQYHQNFHLCDKSDVYSFGVVLVEIITAMKVVDFSRAQNEVNLAALATQRIRDRCFDKIVDPFLAQDASTLSSVHKVAELAFRCLAYHQDMRPSMMEVANELEQIKLNQWVCSGEANFVSTASPEASSTGSNNSASFGVKTCGIFMESRGLFAVHTCGKGCLSSMEIEKDSSPVSVVQDPWLSEESSPSTSCLLGNVVQ